MSEQNRNPREAVTREAFQRPEEWAPPETLPTPVQQPGWVYRWVRVGIQNEDDPANFSRQRREGYEPVMASEQPHMATDSDPRSRYKGGIEIGGLLLCKAPEEFIRKRAAHYAQMTKNAQQSVDQNLMKENDPRMPLFKQSKTKVTFGSGE